MDGWTLLSVFSCGLILGLIIGSLVTAFRILRAMRKAGLPI
jgi:hypothetical protein